MIANFYSCFYWTNINAKLSGADPGGNIYTDYHPFTNKELRQHIGIYIFNGLTPSLRVEQKFNPQRIDKLHRNNFIYGEFGPNA